MLNKKQIYLTGILGVVLFLAGSVSAEAAIGYKNKTTCGSWPIEYKISIKVEAAKIDYSLNPEGFREKLVKEILPDIGEENLDKIGYFVYTMLPDNPERINDQVETITVKDSFEQLALNGTYIPASRPLVSQYGNYFFQATRKNPRLIGIIKESKSNFKLEDMGVSFENKFVKADDDRTIVIFGGCTAHNCGGTQNIVAFDPQNNNAYLLEENSDSTKIYLFGRPDSIVKNILLYDYLLN